MKTRSELMTSHTVGDVECLRVKCRELSFRLILKELPVVTKSEGIATTDVGKYVGSAERGYATPVWTRRQWGIS